MSMTPQERIEHIQAIQVYSEALTDARKQLREAQRRIATLEIQMRREGWTQEDLDLIEPKIEQ
jgi:hypothetical protein